jgi:2-hydroxy-6-oxonona-2,4-dienedioate hydrolase
MTLTDTDVDRGTTYRSVWRYLMTTEFDQGFVEAAGLRTRYVHAGASTNPSLVMIHGTGGHWETFSANLPLLSKHFNCYAFDMLGCGFTDKPDRPYEIKDYVEHALAFLDVMGIEKCSFIGVSLGSWVICRLALDAPERVDKLILNSPAGLLLLSDAQTAAVRNRRTIGADPSWENIETMLDHLFYDSDSLLDDIVAVRQQVHKSPGADHGAVRMTTLFDPEIRQRNLLTEQEWAALDAPTLVMAHVDAPDDYLTTAVTIAELMPNATLSEVHGASHWPHFEQPDLFNEVATAFLQER